SCRDLPDRLTGLATPGNLAAFLDREMAVLPAPHSTTPLKKCCTSFVNSGTPCCLNTGPPPARGRHIVPRSDQLTASGDKFVPHRRLWFLPAQAAHPAAVDPVLPGPDQAALGDPVAAVRDGVARAAREDLQRLPLRLVGAKLGIARHGAQV